MYDRLNSLTYNDFALPGEATALDALRKIPFLDELLNAAMSSFAHATRLPEIQADTYRVTEKTYPRLYSLYALACRRLNIDEMPPLFVKAEFDFNAMSAGGSMPFVVIHSSFVRWGTDEAILAVLGHELGHIMSGYTSYRILAQMLLPLARNIPVAGEWITPALSIALMHWFRMHEYSADRAGAIAAGSPEGMMACLGMCLGATESMPGVQVTTEDLIAQYAVHEEENDNLVSRVVLTAMLMNCNHPWAIDRIHAMQEWQQSGAFDEVVRRAA